MLVAVKSLLAIWFGYIMLYFYVEACLNFHKTAIKSETIVEKHHVNAIYFISIQTLSFHNNKLNH